MTQRVAIVGLAIRFPGAGAEVARFWDNVASGRDCGREVPAGRWVLPPERVVRAGLHADSVPTSRGYYLDPFEPDLTGLAISPDLVSELDPLFHLVLDVGGRAFRTAKTDGLDRRRVGVILGNICLPTEKSNELARKYLGRALRAASRLNPLNRYPAGLPAGLLARALGFGGISFTLDAACASSLYAVKLAADELLAGRADMMLAGGASRPDCLYTQMGFAQLRALSPRGVCSPFSANADGLVVGEGSGIFVLKRLTDAERDGDRIYAMLAGAGLSNDLHGNLLAPAKEGQLRAMRSAYANAKWKPSDVELIECHATGTPVGDAVEFASLRELWNGESFTAGQCAIGSVKSTVGHLLTGAGAAALAKVLLAMERGVKPPQANFGRANAEIDYESGPFRVLNEAAEWKPRTGQPRRAAVSGFGFGGINAHLLLEEWKSPAASIRVSDPDRGAEPIAIVGMGVQVGPWENLREFQEFILGGGQSHPPAPRESGWSNVEAECPPGFFLDELSVPLDRFRIPPKELEAMLPQQVLMLQTAAAALDDCRSESSPNLAERTGAFIGLGLDLNTTNFHLRWAGVAGLPPLTADRVMGALGSIAASRIARAFGFGGPSFTCCSEETSAGRAIELAVRALRRGEIDRALAGGVELIGDPRATLAAHEIKALADDTTLADGAAVIVLKRLSDAQAHGDRIYAVIRGVGSAVGAATDASGPDAATHSSSLLRACQDATVKPEAIGYFDAAASGSVEDDSAEAQALAALAAASPRMHPLSLGASRALVGHTGFAAAGVGLVKAALVLYQQILPPAADVSKPRSELAVEHFDSAASPRFWLADRGELPRRAAVAAAGTDGTAFHCVLEECDSKSVSTLIEVERSQPLGARNEAVFAVEADEAAGLLDGLKRLQAWLPDEPKNIEALARDWFARVPPDSNRKLAVAMAARTVAELKHQLPAAIEILSNRPDARLPDAVKSDPRGVLRDRLFFNPFPLGRGGKLACVFPGSGNHFAGMGRELGVQWPDVLRRQQQANEALHSQFAPHWFWSDEIPAVAGPRDFLFAQVTFGTLSADLLASLGVQADAMIGSSLGESAGLFGMRIWTARDEMYRRLQVSTLFTTDLGPPYNAARTHLQLKQHESFEWVSGIIAAAPDEVRAKLQKNLRAYLLMITGPNECAVGGEADDLAKLVAAVGKPFLKLHGVTLAHCELGRPVREPYFQLHKLPVNPAKLTVYSGAWGRPYAPSEDQCAESITAGLLNTIDVPRLIEAAYRDGVRAFVEVGPGGSTARMIDAILGERPHFARTLAAPRQGAVSQVLRLLAQLIAERFPVSLKELYGGASACAGHQPPKPDGKVITIPTGLDHEGDEPNRIEIPPSAGLPVPEPSPKSAEFNGISRPLPATARIDAGSFVAAAMATSTATAEAHARFLAVQAGFMHTAVAAVQLQNQILASLHRGAPMQTVTVPRALSFEQCMAFAVGKIGDVLGPEFAEIDAFPTRVRLPDGPLMLVDRILNIEGEPKSLTRGRVVTEHTVRGDRWYLDAGRCPTSITVESGQADLFLSGFLGIDFQTRGLAVYRLLDAVVTFHRGLPKVGETIRYDIHIDGFFRQADAWLFRFRFEGTINGQPMLSMQNGVAGFFTQAALAAGQGIVHTKLDTQPVPGKSIDFAPLVPQSRCQLDAAAIEALRRGDFAAAIGPDFAGLNNPMALPGGMLQLVDRAPLLDPTGGRFGLGFIRAEYDIQPDEWFIDCHFIDDKVMPGTLMYECCLHTLRILLHRFGWIGEAGTVCEPVPGIASRLKCRGQVLQSTKTVTYEVSIKEIGYRPEAYAIADALMFADGKPIVEITNLSLRMNLERKDIERYWSKNQPKKSKIYTNQSILAFSNGKPSEAFGEPYRIFDNERVIARLPGPPYQFLDRVIDVQGPPFVLKAGAACVAEYEVPDNAWYFAANRSSKMPFSILLEIALQPCGWLAAYCGSALTSPVDLSFRNLGGEAVQYQPVTPQSGLLTTKVTMTKVATSAGMIIQHYDFLVHNRNGAVYEGKTYFGFFAKDALRNQVGITGAKVPWLTDEQRVFAEESLLPPDAPFPEPSFRMIDRIDGWLPHGGAARLGLVQARIAVDPNAWFFKAHFYQDPVWPGSLGLESFLQLLKYVAWKKWSVPPPGGWRTAAIPIPHQWTYRGQVLPTDKEVSVVLEITAEDRQARRLTAAGYLSVDGRIIYQMSDFTLE